ncbi:cytochrome c-type biogenesis protein [Polycladidibacter stylochi]|uniref:cytochrome c-type biogenesis protein n=1 Tax=Polycladidibacter stylochi TaxID=1807766 RepID=UPI00082E51D0
MKPKKTQGFIAVLFASLWFLFAQQALAVNPDEMLSDPKLEQRAREISKEVRCVVCQNQSIDDSNAKLAKDLRILVRERIKAGDSDQQVLNYLVDRYGEFVLLKPRFELHTLLLWIGGPVILLIGIVFLISAARKRKRDSEPMPLSEKEKEELEDLFKNE